MKNRKYKKVILIIADTLRQISLENHPSKRAKTPNIDYLKENGVSFTNAFTSVTKTDPSITAIMTGKYPVHIGLVNHAELIKANEESNVEKSHLLAEVMKKNGYKTAAVDWLGRWHKRGFDYYSGAIGDFPKINFHFGYNPILSRIYSMRKLTVRLFKREIFMRFFYSFSKTPNIPYDTADKVVNKGIELLKKNKKKTFLYMHFWDPHEPHIRPQGLRSYIFDTVDDTYNAEIEFLDSQIGRLIEYLKKTGELAETLIVFTSDHGENFYESGSPFYHDMLYENVVKVPLIFSNSDFTRKEISSLAQNIDIFPTLVDLLGIKFNKSNIDGISLMPTIIGKKREGREFVYFEDIIKDRRFNFLKKTRRSGIRTSNYKYIQTISGKKNDLTEIVPSGSLKIVNQELYNLNKDSKEKRNIAASNKKLVKKMSQDFELLLQDLNHKRLVDSDLNKKVEKSLITIRQALQKYPKDKVAVAWTGGKDSTVLLHMVRLAFGGKIPFKVVFNDSTMEFDEIYEFIDELSDRWGIDLITIKHSKKEMAEFDATDDRERKKELSRLMKITAINSVVKKYNLKAFIAGIRWDEHESRSREKYFSKRPDHMRIHPILHFEEKDIWEYIHNFGVPYVNLYNKGYRSLGEKPFTKPAKKGEGERSGRERDKEQLMANLRKLGYW